MTHKVNDADYIVVRCNKCWEVITGKYEDHKCQCPNLILDKNGYHECKAMPTHRPDKRCPQYATCSIVWYHAFGDLDENCTKEKTVADCPNKYTIEQMEAKVPIGTPEETQK